LVEKQHANSETREGAKKLEDNARENYGENYSPPYAQKKKKQHCSGEGAEREKRRKVKKERGDLQGIHTKRDLEKQLTTKTRNRRLSGNSFVDGIGQGAG